MKILVKSGLVLSVLLWLCSSCEYDTVVPIKSDLPDTVYFSTDIIPIFEMSCNTNSSCHITGGASPDLTPPNAYNNLILYNLVDTTVMPSETRFARKLSNGESMEKYIRPKEFNLIILWIEQNAPNN